LKQRKKKEKEDKSGNNEEKIEKNEKNEKINQNEEKIQTTKKNIISKATIIPEDLPTSQNLSLHQLRHNLILDILRKNISDHLTENTLDHKQDQPSIPIQKNSLDPKILRILDFGCAEGALSLKIAENFPNSEITAVDGDSKIFRMYKLRKKKECSHDVL